MVRHGAEGDCAQLEAEELAINSFVWSEHILIYTCIYAMSIFNRNLMKIQDTGSDETIQRCSTTNL